MNQLAKHGGTWYSAPKVGAIATVDFFSISNSVDDCLVVSGNGDFYALTAITAPHSTQLDGIAAPFEAALVPESSLTGF
jgi:hypothetical protein